MKKIGLLNVQNIDNYGANLIAYAMERQVAEIVGPSASVETIDFHPDLTKTYEQSGTTKNLYLQYGIKHAIQACAKKILTNVVHKVRTAKIPLKIRDLLKISYHHVRSKSGITEYVAPEQGAYEKRMSNFEMFKQRHLTRTFPCTTREFAGMDFDAIVVGSDVVWKPQRLLSAEEGDAYFLKLCSGTKRIAYAASLGISDKAVMKRLRSRYQAAIAPFDAISIRESSGTKYIQSLFPDRSVCNCIDPVFLRDPDEYDTLISSHCSGKPFLYAYILGDNPTAYQYVEKLAKEKQLQIFYHTRSGVTFLNGISTYSDGPLEFLGRIRNASYVITDSFHGTAFSIIFRKQFFSFTRGVLSVRLENFMSQIGLSSRLLTAVDETTDIDKVIPYETVWNTLEPWIAESKDFLKNAIIGGDSL